MIATPWLFLMEAFPIDYSQISTAAEITAEAIMFAALMAVVILLRRERKKAPGIIGRILFIFAAVTLFLVGLVLALIALSFSL